MAEPTARNQREPIASLRELVRELHGDPATEGLSDNGRPLVPQSDEQVAEAARVRAERVVAARLRGATVARKIRGDDGVPLGQRRQHVAPRGRAPRHAVDEEDHGSGAALAVRDRVPVNGDFAEFTGGCGHDRAR